MSALERAKAGWSFVERLSVKTPQSAGGAYWLREVGSVTQSEGGWVAHALRYSTVVDRLEFGMAHVERVVGSPCLWLRPADGMPWVAYVAQSPQA